MLVVVVVAIFCAGAISASANNVAHPRCAQVAAGNAQLPADGACYGGSSFQQYGTLVMVCLGGAAVGLAVALSLVLLVTGRRGRLFLGALGSGVALILIGILITHASSSRLPRGAAARDSPSIPVVGCIRDRCMMARKTDERRRFPLRGAPGGGTGA